MKNNEINDIEVYNLTKDLLLKHSLKGYFINDEDLNNSKKHSHITLEFVLEILSDDKIDEKEKILLLKNIKNEIQKFKGYK